MPIPKRDPHELIRREAYQRMLSYQTDMSQLREELIDEETMSAGPGVIPPFTKDGHHWVLENGKWVDVLDISPECEHHAKVRGCGCPPGAPVYCPTCGGAGNLTVTEQDEEDPACFVIVGSKICSTCNGSGLLAPLPPEVQDETPESDYRRELTFDDDTGHFVDADGGYEPQKPENIDLPPAMPTMDEWLKSNQIPEMYWQHFKEQPGYAFGDYEVIRCGGCQGSGHNISGETCPLCNGRGEIKFIRK